MFTDLRIKIRKFIREHKFQVVLILVIWAILIAVSVILNNTQESTPITTYEPFTPIIDNGEKTPAKVGNKIEDIIDEYIGYCNNKEYEKAYNMISKECRESIYPTIEDFKAYVDYVFSGYRLYTIQNYSNRDNTYIYRIRIFEDIMSTGLTYSDTFKYFEEKLVFTEKDGILQMAVKDYIGSEKMDIMYEDQYVRISVTNKSMMYDTETYTIEIQNKTEYYIVVSDDIYQAEVVLQTENGSISRNIGEDWQAIYVMPRTKQSFNVSFNKFYDEAIESVEIRLGSIRILRSYSGEDSQKQQELENAISLYSLVLPLK